MDIIYPNVSKNVIFNSVAHLPCYKQNNFDHQNISNNFGTCFFFIYVALWLTAALTIPDTLRITLNQLWRQIAASLPSYQELSAVATVSKVNHNISPLNSSNALPNNSSLFFAKDSSELWYLSSKTLYTQNIDYKTGNSSALLITCEYFTMPYLYNNASMYDFLTIKQINIPLCVTL